MKSHRNLSQTSRSSCELLQSARFASFVARNMRASLICSQPRLLQSAKRSARHSVSVYCTLTCGPPDSPPSSSARHSVSGVSKDVLHDLYL